MATQFDTRSVLTNERLRKDLRDGLADQKGSISKKLAAVQELTAKEKKTLKSMLADRAGAITDKLATAAALASFSGQVAGMTTDVVITADEAGAAGNDVLLTFDGVADIAAVLAAWNLANPTKTASVTSGDDSQIPDNAEEIQLASGSDAPALTAKEKETLQDMLADMPKAVTDKLAAREDFSA